MIRKIFFMTLGLILLINLSHAQVKRPYEPVVIKGDTLSQFSNYEIKYLYVYAYDANLNSWQMIPFQIDEVNPKVKDSLKYFIPEDSLSGLLDSDDELVFMLGDLGDNADSTKWLAGTDSIRYEISFFDSLTNHNGYAYLYFSTSITEPIPDTYAMAYDSLKDRVISANYELGFNATGQVGDVIIKSGIGGAGTDIFDRLKVRLIGSLWILPIFLYEDNVKMVYSYAKVGPVRVIRNMYGLLVYDPLNYEDDFTQTSFFYPWNGTFALFEIPIKDVAESGAKVDVVRVSWDFDRNATGMKFYSEKNRNEILIDGKQDNIDPFCSPDELNWTMGAGDQGSILNIFYVPPLGDKIRIYYYEATDGTAGDPILPKDSGDNSSFGDSGFSLEKNVDKYAKDHPSLDVAYYNFFLPPNFNPDDASTICSQLKSPVSYVTSTQKMPRPSEVAQFDDLFPISYALFQNYPNPFNSTTMISFSLPKRDEVSLRIYDSLGRLVATLVEGTLAQGVHRYTWQGLDERGLPLPTGLYFYKLETNEFNSTKKLILIK